MKPIALKILFVAIFCYMLFVTVTTSMQSSLFVELPRLSRDPWTVATLKDFYLNIALISVWMFYKERSWFSRILWLLAFVALGSMATSLYGLVQLCRIAPGDPLETMLLRRSTKP